VQQNEINDELSAAIEEANRLNGEAGKALEKAIKKAIAAGVDDYAFTAAKRMLDTYIRAHNIAARHFIIRRKKLKAAAAKAARG
jgi:hypothetical protein